MKRILYCLFFITSIQAHATNYYFSTSGSDGNAGTSPGSPFQTLAKANSLLLNAGDNVFFKSGDTFFGTLTFTRSGTAANPIIYDSYDTGSRPAISGFYRVNTWTDKGGGIYESEAMPTGTTVNMVNIGGVEFPMGRYPNANTSDGGYLTYESHTSSSITDNQKPSLLDATWNGAQLVAKTRHYVINRPTISTISGNTFSFAYTTDLPMIEGGVVQDGFGYFIQNSIKTLDQYGEWYYNPTTHKISVYFGSADPNAVPVQVSALDVLITTHASHIKLHDLCIKGANQYGIFNDWAGIADIKLISCRVVFSGIDHIYIAGMNDFSADSCILNYANGNAFAFNNGNNKPSVTNTTIKNTGIFDGMITPDAAVKYGTAIFTGTDSVTIVNNDIINTGFIGINNTGGSHISVKNNFIDSFSFVLDDGGALYSVTKTSTNYTDRNWIGNVIVNGIGAPNGTPDHGTFGAQIYFDDNSANFLCKGNTVANGNYPALFIHNSHHLTIINNVFYNNKDQFTAQYDGLAAAITNCIIKHNQIFSSDTTSLLFKYGSINDDAGNIGVIDSNYYDRPFKEKDVILTQWYRHSDILYSLAEWQNKWATTVQYDKVSIKTPIPVTDASDIIFRFNSNMTSRIKLLCMRYMEPTGATHLSFADLNTYSSIILLRN